MLFGLKKKKTSSEFQKAMTKNLKPILHSALVNIDDILLFSSNLEGYLALLQEFHSLVKKYGIMLSQRKMVIA